MSHKPLPIQVAPQNLRPNALVITGTLGNTGTVDVTSLTTLASDLGNFTPLNAPLTDPNCNSLTFTENLSVLNSTDSNVILVGEGTAAPEPAAAALLLVGAGVAFGPSALRQLTIVAH
jgi:hypothetical protein